MSLLNQYIIDLILHYSEVHDKEVSRMICSERVPSEVDAKRLLSFLNTLAKYSVQDMQEGKMVLGELANTYNTDKAAMAILALLEENNFGSLVDEWMVS